MDEIFTGMPTNDDGINTSVSTPFTGKLPEDKEKVLNSGINLFELRKPRANPMGYQDFGPIDVTVTDVINDVTLLNGTQAIRLI